MLIFFLLHKVCKPFLPSAPSLFCANTHEFVLMPENSQTIVNWTMKDNAPFYFKIIMVFVSCDTMMADNLESGLVNLKALVSDRAADLAG